MKTLLKIILLYVIAQIELTAQCEPIMMDGSGAEYTEEICYIEETDLGFSIYLRRYYFLSNVDDPRNGIYIQERDTCLQLNRESLFLRTIDVKDRIFAPKDRISIFKSKLPEYIWILSGVGGLKFNITNREQLIFRFQSSLVLENLNFVELDNGNFVVQGQSTGLIILDSNFQKIASYRSFRNPFNKIENQSLFYRFEPTPLPLFTIDSSILYSDLNGTIHWKYTYPIQKMPYFLHGDFSDSNHFLVGSADPDGNDVASNPVIYKLDKSGQLISNIFLETNKFKAAQAEHCIYAHHHLFVLGWQTISRTPKEIAQTFVAKLDTNLNLIWKKDLKVDCNRLGSHFRRPVPTKDGGILIHIAPNMQGGDSCLPVLIKLNGDGRIATFSENVENDELNIFPNPVKDFIDLGSEMASEIKSIRLLDLNGIDFEIKLIGSGLDMSNMMAGIYMMRFELNNGKVLYKKIIKI